MFIRVQPTKVQKKIDMKLIFATNNAHKLHEVREKLQICNPNIKVVSLSEIGFFDDIPETGTTLEANARLKAQAIYDFCRRDAMHCVSTITTAIIADDTGLEIESLNGEPGVYSARYAEMQNDEGVERSRNAPTFDDNMNLVLSKLQGKTNRKACFKTVIALILDGKTHYFEGRVDGEITTEKHGTEGFGYDPVFRPSGYDETFAELALEEKNKISHRGRAVDELVRFLTKN
jgi:XTP/dITP diphosphohydrolase